MTVVHLHLFMITGCLHQQECNVCMHTLFRICTCACGLFEQAQMWCAYHLMRVYMYLCISPRARVHLLVDLSQRARVPARVHVPVDISPRAHVQVLVHAGGKHVTSVTLRTRIQYLCT